MHIERETETLLPREGSRTLTTPTGDDAAPGCDAAGDRPITLETHGLSKSFGSGSERVEAVRDMNLAVRAGEFLTLLGPSGSGKTTLLNLLAGLQRPSSGRVVIDGRDVTRLPPDKREIGVVFQNYALFPHLRVEDNIAFPLKLRKRPRAEIARRVQEVLALVQMPHLARRYPTQLSGGQQQRVAIARALVFEPKLLLMDEPLGALDRQLRERMQLDLRALQQRVGITCIYVTHDQDEAMTMSDRIAVMAEGRLEQLATPREIYRAPATSFVSEFVGRVNLWQGNVRETGPDGTLVEIAKTLVIRSRQRAPLGSAVQVAVRPEALRVVADNTRPEAIPLTVKTVRFTGASTLIVGELPGGVEVIVQADATDADALPLESTALMVDPAAVSMFVVDDDERDNEGD